MRILRFEKYLLHDPVELSYFYSLILVRRVVALRQQLKKSFKPHVAYQSALKLLYFKLKLFTNTYVIFLIKLDNLKAFQIFFIYNKIIFYLK